MCKILFVLWGLMTPLCALAKNVIAVVAPEEVTQNQEFSVQYVISAENVQEFRTDKFPLSFNVLYGPSKSVMSFQENINGKKTKENTTTYTYTITVKDVGTFSLPRAHATVGGKVLYSAIRRIRILSDNGRSKGNLDEETVSKDFDGKELFFRVSANRKQLYEQEPVVLTYKIYTRANLVQLGGKMPDLRGFVSTEVPSSEKKSFSIEKLNGKNYKTTIWSQYVIFPQQSGPQTIPSIPFEAIVAIRRKGADPLDAFFGEEEDVRVKRKVPAPSVDLRIKPLPKDKPENFSGAVGQFKLSWKILSPEARKNENLKLRITLSGEGNLKLLKAPSFPKNKDFDVFEPVVTDDTRITADGIRGNMYYDYILVPKKVGECRLEPISFYSFNPKREIFVNLSTGPLAVKVLPGKKSSNVESVSYSQEDDSADAQSSPLHRLKKFLLEENKIILFSVFLLLIAAFLLLSFFFWNKRKGKKSSNRYRTAFKRASQQLKDAKCLKDHSSVEFVGLINSGIRGYVIERFNLTPTLSASEMCDLMKKSGIRQEQTERWKKILQECELRQYAPAKDPDGAEQLFLDAQKLLQEMEKETKFNLFFRRIG